MNKDTELYLF